MARATQICVTISTQLHYIKPHPRDGSIPSGTGAAMASKCAPIPMNVKVNVVLQTAICLCTLTIPGSRSGSTKVRRSKVWVIYPQKGMGYGLWVMNLYLPHTNSGYGKSYGLWGSMVYEGYGLRGSRLYCIHSAS